MAKRKPSTNPAGEPVLRTEQVTEQGSDSPRLKTSPRGYLVIAGTGAVLTPEMVKEASEDPPLSRLTEEISEMAGVQFRLGIMAQAQHDEITLRRPETQVPKPRKAPTKKVRNRVREAILGTNDLLLRLGSIGKAEHDETILRHPEPQAPKPKRAPAKKVPNRAIEAILEMAEDQHRSGLMYNDAYHTIILRHSEAQPPSAAKPSTGGVKGVHIRKKL
jgi:hypothetical protein